MKSTRWHAKVSGYFYAFGPFVYEKPIDERDFRQQLRMWLNVNKLPNKTEVFCS